MRVLLLTSALLLTSGCYKINYNNGGMASGAANSDTMHLSLVYGLVELDEESAKKHCPSGFRSIEQEMSIVDWLIQAITGSIVVTRTMKFHCNDGTAGTFDVDEDGRIVADAE